MWISEDDCHSPKFSLPHKVELLVRSTMKLFLPDSIIWNIRMRTNSYGRENSDSFRDMSD